MGTPSLPAVRRIAPLTAAAASLVLAVPAPSAAGTQAPSAATARERAAPLTFRITSTADSHDAKPGDGRCADSQGRCTLRAAVEEAVAQPPGTPVTINVPAGRYVLTLGSLSLSTGTISVIGAGAPTTVVRAMGRFRVIRVSSGVTATLARLTITGGDPGPSSYGGGVLSEGTLVVRGSVVAGNQATAGGGIANAGGTLTVSHSLIAGNHAPSFGGGGLQNGGIHNLAGTVTVIESRIMGNDAGGDGAGILNGQNGHPAAPGLAAVPVRSGCARIRRCAGARYEAVTGAAHPALPLRLVVIRSLIDHNMGTNGGAGIANDGGTALVTDSTLRHNVALGSPGGGIADLGPLTLSGDLLQGNAAPNSYGGAVEVTGGPVRGRQTITRSMLVGNSAGLGGAIDNNSATLHVTASTLAHNAARAGGGIELEGASFVSLLNSTLTGNTAKAGQGGAIDSFSCGGGAVSYSTLAGNSSALNLPCSDLQITGSILATSAPGPNCTGSPPHETAGYNLDSGTSCHLSKATDLRGSNPVLGPQENNGGRTHTMAPHTGSPAIGHGGTRATGCPATDQRGLPRPDGPACDIGAVELQLAG
jgi:hypothetical protein